MPWPWEILFVYLLRLQTYGSSCLFCARVLMFYRYLYAFCLLEGHPKDYLMSSKFVCILKVHLSSFCRYSILSLTGEQM